jgi:uncharacterized protein YjbJ (UPF0337 family)
VCKSALTRGHNRADSRLLGAHDDVASGKQEGCGLHESSSILLQRRRDKEQDAMKPSTKDQAEGKFHEVKGKIKEKVGKATKNTHLENEGTAEKTAGKVQKKIGQVEKVLGD